MVLWSFRSMKNKGHPDELLSLGLLVLSTCYSCEIQSCALAAVSYSITQSCITAREALGL